MASGDHILVPYDGSAPAKDAVRYALETYPDATFTLFHVVPVPEGYWAAFEDSQTPTPGYDRARERGEELLAEAAEIAAEGDADATVETEIATGRPKHAIAERAESGEFDAVVMGSHGREGAERILLGSVAENVVRRSPIPVVTVP
ncbi:universal stress protein [Salinilacihabitans rarus]|uniref:universal stress protein n=1 Tax=Salinilacihabitans rarus TaxID=2961596 RepID=UPI0020C8CCEE|nr:universal stress protein [Salinilacihabitans rarus]